jgi:hypothetical protein
LRWMDGSSGRHGLQHSRHSMALQDGPQNQRALHLSIAAEAFSFSCALKPASSQPGGAWWPRDRQPGGTLPSQSASQGVLYPASLGHNQLHSMQLHPNLGMEAKQVQAGHKQSALQSARPPATDQSSTAASALSAVAWCCGWPPHTVPLYHTDRPGAANLLHGWKTTAQHRCCDPGGGWRAVYRRRHRRWAEPATPKQTLALTLADSAQQGAGLRQARF